MNPVKSEIEIQAVNLAQQWYSMPHESMPELTDLLSRYLHCFSEPADQQQFIKETLRITDELVDGPKAAAIPEQSITAFKDALKSHLTD